MTVDHKPGCKLSPETTRTINEYRVREFGSKTEIDPTTNERDARDLFFLLQEGNRELLAFGRLAEQEVLFQDTKYYVLCASTIIATEKRHGFGTKILDAMRQFSEERGKTILGFCETTLLPFYQKAGFETLSPEENQFVYANSEGEIIPDFVPGEVFYVDGEDKTFEKILQAKDKTVMVMTT